MLSRESETFTDRETRLNCMRVRTANTLSQETPEERQARLPRGTRADEVKACLKSSVLWHYIIPRHLTIYKYAGAKWGK